jgi:hypothetical protein
MSRNRIAKDNMSQDEYIHVIYQRIKQRFEIRYGTKKAIIINITAAVLLNSGLYFLFFYLWGQDTANQQILSFLVLSVALEIIIFGASWAFWRFSDVPAEIYKEKIETIKELSAAAADVRLDFELFPRYFDGYASIKVHNQESDDIEECTLSLLSAIKINGEKTESILDRINPDNVYISWGGGYSKKGTIIGKSAATFNLALHNEDNFLFLLDNGNKQLVEPGLYKLKVAIDGKKNGKKIKRKTKTFFLEYLVRILKIPVQDGDEINYAVKKATYLDIRSTKFSNKDIEPSQLVDLDGNTFIRFVVQDAKSQQAQGKSDKQ